MDIYPIYVLKVFAIQSLFFGIYRLLVNKDRGLHFNRYFLLVTLVLPFAVPFIKIPIGFVNRQILTAASFEPLQFTAPPHSDIPMTQPENLAAGMDWTIILLFIYITITTCFLIRLIFTYWRIIKLSKQSSKTELSPKGFLLFHIPSKVLSFSFLRHIFLSDQFQINPHEKMTIIAHEEYHLTQYHSLDILLSEIVRALFWFNPFLFLLQKYLKENHEYLADDHTSKRFGREGYAQLLKSFQWNEISMQLGNAYSSASITKRLKTMNNSNKQPKAGRMILATVLMLFTMLFFACEENLRSFDQEQSELTFQFSDEDLEMEIEKMMTIYKKAPPEVLDLYEELQRNQPQYRFSLMVRPVYNELNSGQTLEEISAEWRNFRPPEREIEYIRFLTQEEFDKFFTEKIFNNGKLTIINAYAMIGKVDRLKEAEHRYKMSADEEIHDDFDKKASFKGGEIAFKRLINQRLTYPEIARKNKIEDKVVFQFVVNKQGYLLYLNIDERASTKNEEIRVEFEKTAFEVLKSTEGMWQPAEKDGKYVMSRMTVPVEFKLEE